MHEAPQKLTLDRSLIRITLAGCLGMVYVTIVTSPFVVAFFRALGASELMFGLIGGIPMAMLFMQFAGAVLANRLTRRKIVFMTCVICARLFYIPIAFTPMIFASLGRGVLLGIMIFLLAAGSALANTAEPLWFSWMADLIPRRVLNSYWGRRQRWMHITWTGSFVGIAAIAYLVNLSALVIFPALVVLAVIAGICDILLFRRIEEPQNMVSGGGPIAGTIVAPLLHNEYRSFLLSNCTWYFFSMFASAFMTLYVLKILGMSLWEAMLMWCFMGIGTALFSTWWGRIADRHGHKPVLLLCYLFKPLIIMAFLFVNSGNAFYILSAACLADGALNAGLMVASNGYMLKTAPRRNRSMFIAAALGFAGIFGGLGAVAGGKFLDVYSNFSLVFAGRDWNNYQLMFFVNIFMRLLCILPALYIIEPKSSPPAKLLNSMLGAWPLRFLMFPVGLYRRIGNSRAVDRDV